MKIVINEHTSVECTEGDNNKIINLVDKLAHNGKHYNDKSYIYCPKNIDRFCVASEIEYFKNDGLIPYENS